MKKITVIYGKDANSREKLARDIADGTSGEIIRSDKPNWEQYLNLTNNDNPVVIDMSGYLELSVPVFHAMTMHCKLRYVEANEIWTIR